MDGREGVLKPRWPALEWETEEGRRYSLACHPFDNGEFRFDLRHHSRREFLCTNLSRQAAVDLVARLTEALEATDD